MIKPLARIIFRENTDISNPDLVLGTCFQNQHVFKGNEVWQIEDILGEIIVKKMGQSIMNSGDYTGYTWSRSVNDLLNMGKHIYLTKDEMAAVGILEQIGKRKK